MREGAGQESGAEGGSGAWGPGGRHRLGSGLQVLQVTLSFMGILKRMSGTRGFFSPFSFSLVFYLFFFSFFFLTLITAVTTAGFLSQACPLGALGPAEHWVLGRIGYFLLEWGGVAWLVVAACCLPLQTGEGPRCPI